MTATAPLTLKTLLGNYPHTQPLRSVAVASPLVRFDFAEVKSAFEGFKPLIREKRFDVGELAIVSYLQAKIHGTPYVLMPAVMLGRGQHHMIVYNAERGELRPADLPGRRVGVRAYTQTTGAWLRGILRHDYGVDTDRVRWVTFEDAHVAEYRDPPGVERAPAGKVLLDMLLAGEVDAAIVAQIPDDKRVKSLISDAPAAARDMGTPASSKTRSAAGARCCATVTGSTAATPDRCPPSSPTAAIRCTRKPFRSAP